MTGEDTTANDAPNSTAPPADTQPATGATDPGQQAPAFRFGFTRDWPAYFAVMDGKGPRDTTLRALDAFAAEGVPDADRIARAEVPIPLAVDLGCGEGRDTQEILARGWRCVAIDGHEAAFRNMAKRGILDHPALDARHEPMEECAIPACHLLNASFSLPFCHPDRFRALWTIIRHAIEPGGRLACQLFGDRDTWAAIPDRSHFTRAEAEALLEGFEVEYFEEDEKDSTDAEGHDKHWHVFHIVARQPDDA
jgi:tellurite methyltransferase